MTDNLFPFVADGLVDGGLAADAAPPDLRAAVDVLRTASQQGSAAELATMADCVQQFTAEVDAATAARSTIQTTAPADTTSGSIPMFATRITRKAMTIVAITLLAAGTAAAAAGGALPMFEDDAPEVVVENVDGDGVDVAEDRTHDSDTTQPDDDDATDSSVVATVVENKNGDVDHHGKCTAWTNGSAKSAANPAFVELQVAADAAGVTIDEYCETFLGTNSGDDDESDDTDNGKGNGNDKDDHDKGNDKDGHDNSGKGNDGEDEDSGNGNSGSGNSGSGNSGSGNSGHGGGNSGNSGHGGGNSGSGNGNDDDED